VLNCIHGYPRDEEPGRVRTDVFSFHADSAPVEADTWLCTYHGRRARACAMTRRSGVWTFRNPRRTSGALRGEDGDDFREYLRENCYDLHYGRDPQSRPFLSASEISGASPWTGRAVRSRLACIARRDAARRAAEVAAD